MTDNERAMNEPNRSPAELESISDYAVEHYWGSKLSQREEGRCLYLRKGNIGLHINYRFDDWIGRWEFFSAEASRVGGEGSEPRYRIDPDCILHIIRNPRDIEKALP